MRNMTGKVQTVLGQVEPGTLGITLPHEHFLIDGTAWFVEPSLVGERLRAHQPVTVHNVNWVRYNPTKSLDNWQLLDEDIAVEEGIRFRHAGGVSVVDLTSVGLGRDPVALARISRKTGLNIVMGSGYYLEQLWPHRPSEDEMAEEIERDILVGVGSSRVAAGIIGEIGVETFGPSSPMPDIYRLSLRAAAKAQKRTGAGINVHCGHSPDSPFEIVDELERAGADISRVAISHIDRTMFEHNRRIELARTGCFLEYDLFSMEGWHTVRMVLSEENPVKMDLPNDAQRVNEVRSLIDAGFCRQILMSHDHCMKHRLWHYGGPGFAHILENVVPLMLQKGIDAEAIHTILVENPRRLLTFA